MVEQERFLRMALSLINNLSYNIQIKFWAEELDR